MLLFVGANEPHVAGAYKSARLINNEFLLHVYLQNDRYTVGGKDVFDNLTDLVEHFKRVGIEELSGTMVSLKQVKDTGIVLFF